MEALKSVPSVDWVREERFCSVTVAVVAFCASLSLSLSPPPQIWTEVLARTISCWLLLVGSPSHSCSFVLSYFLYGLFFVLFFYMFQVFVFIEMLLYFVKKVEK